MTQGQLAERSGVKEATIVHLEGGQTAAGLATIQKLAEVLRVSPIDLTRPAGERT